MTNPPTLSNEAKRSLGAYYTPSNAVSLMASWIMDHSPEAILEPSFGDGGFLVALKEESKRRHVAPRLVGAELQPSAFRYVTRELKIGIEGHAGDFLALKTQPVDAVIGNPPFVRLRHLSAEQRATALATSKSAMGANVDPSGSTWMSFVLHASRFVNPGGSMALVLPLEFTHVRYARPLWKYLGESFARIKIVRTYERMFPDLLQDVIILLAEGRGESTETIEFQAIHELLHLDGDENVVRLPIQDVASGNRAFVFALLPDDARELAIAKLWPSTNAVGELATVRIGYVTGDKTYFHPDTAAKRQFQLPARSLRPSISNGRRLRGCGLHTSALDETDSQVLWTPDQSRLTAGEKRYVDYGVAAGINQRYKCAVRAPWYVVPGVEIPDVVFSVFSDNPILMLNDGQLAVSNSLLTATMNRDSRAEDLAAGWYSSLTQLSIELEIHSLGGGVLIAVPNELSKVRIPLLRATTKHLKELDRALGKGDHFTARQVGDAALLKSGVLSTKQLTMIKNSIATLQEWRRRPTRDR